MVDEVNVRNCTVVETECGRSGSQLSGGKGDTSERDVNSEEVVDEM